MTLQRAENAVHSREGSALIALSSTHKAETSPVSFIPFIQPSIWIDQKPVHLYTASNCPSIDALLPSADGCADSTAQRSQRLSRSLDWVCATGSSPAVDVALRVMRAGEDDPVGSAHTHTHGHTNSHRGGAATSLLLFHILLLSARQLSTVLGI